MDPKMEPKKDPHADLTERRRARCEPIVKEMLQKLLDEDLLLSDMDYLKTVVREEFEVMFKSIIFLHAETIFDMLFQSLNHALIKANQIKWGHKDKDEISVRDVDETLTGKKTTARKIVSLKDAQDKESK
jgi:hypothetical protein